MRNNPKQTKRRISTIFYIQMFWLSLAFVLPSAAAIASDNGWYVKAVGGFGWLGDTNFSGSDDRAGELTFDAGFGAGATAGYDLGRWRLEGEYLYQTNDTDSFSGTGLPTGAEGGDFSSVAIAASAIAEWNLFGSDKAISYAGAGLVWLQEVDVDFDTDAGELSFSTDELGFQVLAGVEYQISDHWIATGELRYLSVGEIELDGEGLATGSVNADYDRTSLLFSIGYRF